MATSNQIVESTTVELPTKEIKVPAGFNVRAGATSKDMTEHRRSMTDDGRPCCYSHGIQYLSEDIKQHGLITPPTVRKVGKGYELIAGFRRMAALELLGRKTVKVQLVGEISDQVAYLLNLTENMSREDLTSYEIAARCNFLSRKFKWDGNEIATKLAKSKGYVNNLLRCFEKLPKEIIAAWKDGDKRCKTDKLNTYAKMKDHAEMLAAFEADAPKQRGEKGGGEETERKRSRKYDVLAEAIELTKTSSMSVHVKEVVIATLSFAMGTVDEVKGVKLILEKFSKEATEAEEAQKADELETEVDEVTDRVMRKL